MDEPHAVSGVSKSAIRHIERDVPEDTVAAIAGLEDLDSRACGSRDALAAEETTVRQMKLPVHTDREAIFAAISAALSLSTD